jgi:hypothetical protein
MGRSVAESNDLDSGSDRCDTSTTHAQNALSHNTTTNWPSDEHLNHEISVASKLASQPQYNKSNLRTIATTRGVTTVLNIKVRGWLLCGLWCVSPPPSQLQPIQVGYSIPVFCCISYIVAWYFVPITCIGHSACTAIHHSTFHTRKLDCC